MLFHKIGLVCFALCLASSIGSSMANEPTEVKFVCPGEGKWPNGTDCSRYYNCQAGQEPIHSWCGPGMSFDADKKRCELASTVNCNEGDRPDWTPPDNWPGKNGQKPTTTSTKKLTTSNSGKSDQSANEDDSNSASKSSMGEDEPCSFTGLLADKENCQSYFYCKDSTTKKEWCVDKQLFDEESKSCKEYNVTFCGERPVNDKSNSGNKMSDPCRSKPNGVYANLETRCADFFQCAQGTKTKTGECPQSLKFNSLTLRCDWSSNVPPPCGTRGLHIANNNGNGSGFASHAASPLVAKSQTLAILLLNMAALSLFV